MNMVNRQVILRERPKGAISAEHFEIIEGALPEPGTDEALVRVAWLGIDATQRTWLNASATYTHPVAIGEVMRGSGVGQVVASRTERLAVGDWVYGLTGWQEYVVVSGEGLYGLNRVPDGVDPKAMLSVLGASGLTAYFGITAVGAPIAGSTVFVSAAAGSVGSIAGQIARNLGARVIGSAGGEKKCRWAIESAGFDACIDYRQENVRERLRSFAPEGIDVVFDNVGGTVLEDALDNLALHARVVLCGSVSSGYREESYGAGPSNYMQLGFRRARMEGFIFLDYLDRFPTAFEDLSRWVSEGRLNCREDIVDGLENAPAALQGLFEGRNIGKRLVRLSSEQP